MALPLSPARPELFNAVATRLVLLKQGQFCSPPPGDIWQCLETFMVVMRMGMLYCTCHASRGLPACLSGFAKPCECSPGQRRDTAWVLCGWLWEKGGRVYTPRGCPQVPLVSSEFSSPRSSNFQEAAKQSSFLLEDAPASHCPLFPDHAPGSSCGALAPTPPWPRVLLG